MVNKMERQKRNNRVQIIMGITSLIFFIIVTWINCKKSGMSWTYLYIAIASTVVLSIIYLILFKLNPASSLHKWVVTFTFATVFLILYIPSPSCILIIGGLAFATTMILYDDKKFIIIALIICGIAGSLLSLLKGFVFSNVPAAEALISTIAVVLFIDMLIFVIRILHGNIHEDQKKIEEQKAEQGRQLQHLEEISKQLKELIQTGAGQSEDLHTKLDHMVETVDEISQSTCETAQSIQTQTELTEKIGGMVSEVKEEKDRLDNHMKGFLEATTHGKMEIENLIKSSGQLEKESQDITDKIKEINENIKDVQGITTVISSISAQTNLLSLNASIEAARAGESGKGFAVVADEIRTLSENTKDSTGKIENILTNFAELIEMTIKDMNEVSDAVKKELEYVDHVGEQFETISNQLENASESVDQIDKKCGNLEDANKGIIDHIQTLSASSEEVAAQAESTVMLQENAKEAAQIIADSLSGMLEIASSMTKEE